MHVSVEKLSAREETAAMSNLIELRFWASKIQFPYGVQIPVDPNVYSASPQQLNLVTAVMRQTQV